MIEDHNIAMRRFGPGQPSGECVDPQCIVCAYWECQSRNECRKKTDSTPDNRVIDFSLPWSEES